jgi:hypothetical protein
MGEMEEWLTVDCLTSTVNHQLTTKNHQPTTNS